MFYPENKQSDTATEQKSYGQELSFGEYLLKSGNDDLSAYAALCLYTEAMPFFNAVDIRATAFSQIPIRLYDKAKEEYVDKHPVLDLIKNPNVDQSSIEFLYALSSFYDVTGENFIVSNGRVNGPILEMVLVSPAFTTFGLQDNRFGLLNIPKNIKVQSPNSSERIYSAEDNRGRLRFINRNKDQELYHMKSFNPLKAMGSYRGLSKAKPLWLELQQYVSGNRTNLSMLKRGTRLSMAWVNTASEALTAVQWERMQQEAQKYSGDQNAGGTPILDGMDVKPIQQTNRDMEFGKLQDAMLSRVSNTFDVPLALLLDSSMTMNNLETAIIHLYDMGVLPHAKRMYDELGRLILPRYPGTENMEFRYNENEIPAVRSRLIETAKRQKDISVSSTNELRALIGEKALDKGGDEILVPANVAPLDRVENPTNTTNPVNSNNNEATGETLLDEATKGGKFEYFASVLRKSMNEDGTRRYSEAKILAMGIEQGLLRGDQ